MHYTRLRLFFFVLTTALVAIASTAIPVAASAASVAPASGRYRATPALPPGVRPATPPKPGTYPRLQGFVPSTDQIGCDLGDSIRSAANNDWVSAELGGTGDTYARLRARATAIGPWEIFDFCDDFTQNFWFIVSDANKMAVSTELGGTGNDYARLRARATIIGPWEQYAIGCTPNHTLVIKSLANNMFVSTEIDFTGDNYGLLRARATSVQGWEQYHSHNGNLPC